MNESRMMSLVRHEACMGEMRNAYKILTRKPVGNRPRRKHRHRWDDNVKIYLTEIGWEGADWMKSGSGQGPVAGSCEHSNGH